MNTAEIKVKIPYGLATRYAASRPMTRAFATFCRLKALESSSRFTAWRKLSASMAEFCHISTRTLDTRIMEMKMVGLCKVDKGELILASWDDVWKRNQLDDTRKKYWNYENTKIPYKLEYLFQFLALKEAGKKMKSAYEHKVEKFPGLRNDLKSILGMHHTASITMQDHLAGILQAFKQPELFTEEEQLVLNLYNPDDQVSVRYMRKLYGYSEKSVSGPSYRKKILAKIGIVKIEKRNLTSEGRLRKCVPGTVHYSRNSRTTFLRMCDRIAPIS
jgi:hypothetical protein